MLKQIIIHLDSTDANLASWILLDETNKAQSTGKGALSDIKINTQDLDVIVIVPAQDVLLLSAKLPKLNRYRLQQALPYALEEQLIDDIDDLNFAVGAYQADGTYPVAVITQQKIEGWLAALNNVNIAPTVLIPESLALPYSATLWQIAIEDNTAVLRSGIFDGLACDKDNLATILTLKLAETAQKPQQIQLNNYTEAALNIKVANIEVIEKNLPLNHFIYDLANWNDATPAINLLQGDYQPKRKTTQIKKVWLATGYLAVAIIAFAFFSNLVSFFILHHQVSKLDDAITAIYHRNFPGATSTTAPKERIMEKLKKLDAQAGQNRFLLWLGFVSKSMAQVPGIRLTNLNFNLDQLTLELSAPSFDILDNFTQNISQQGLTVRQQNAAALGGQVKTNLLISGAGA